MKREGGIVDGGEGGRGRKRVREGGGRKSEGGRGKRT